MWFGTTQLLQSPRTMELSLIVIFLCLCHTLPKSVSFEFTYTIESGQDDDIVWDEQMYWNNDVYTGRHFDELVSSYVGDIRIVNRHSLLVFYDDDSFDDIQSYDLTVNGLPKEKFLNYAKYNIRSSPKHIWYPLLGVDDLVGRYLNSKVTALRNPRIFFFKAGNTLDDAVEFPMDQFDLDDNSGDYKLWVWDQLQMRLLIQNNLNTPVRVKFYGDAPGNDALTITAGDKVLLAVHVSTVVTVVDETDKLVKAFLVEQGIEDSIIAINHQSRQQFSSQTEHQWLTDTGEMIQRDSLLMRQFAEYMADGYLRQFKQPALVSKYSKLGYLIKPIPQDILQSLLELYDKGQNTRERGCILADGTRNGGDIECTCIPIQLHHKFELSEKLKPELEKWCGKNLEMTHVYGINEYWGKSERMQTMGKVTDHVISAELVIKKELHEQPDWELEILNNKGSVEYTYLDVGMMIVYESSSVPIKRPRPFTGRSYITVVFHYRPRIGWPWKLAGEDLFLSDGHAWENLKLFNTLGTFRKDKTKVNSPPRHIHDL